MAPSTMLGTPNPGCGVALSPFSLPKPASVWLGNGSEGRGGLGSPSSYSIWGQAHPSSPIAQPQRAGQTDRQSWMHAGGHGHFHTSPSAASRPARCSARGSKKETHKTQKHNPPGAPAQPRRAGSPAARGVSRLFSVLKEQKIPIHFFLMEKPPGTAVCRLGLSLSAQAQARGGCQEDVSAPPCSATAPSLLGKGCSVLILPD